MDGKGRIMPPELLHIYPQEFWHGYAKIMGTQGALRKLGEALIAVADAPQVASARAGWFMPADGEGYAVAIESATQEQMRSASLPYATPGASPELSFAEQNKDKT